MGKFITFEGVDGAGKSTHLSNFVAGLRARGAEVVLTREPGGTALGESLREILLHQAMDSHTEALLMFAARQEHIAQVIRPALAAGKWVVSDRFADASFAYQGGGRGLDWGKLQQLEHWVLGDLQPDLTVFFDLPIEVARERLNRDGNLDKFEQEQGDFFERVRAGYHRRMAEQPQRYVCIDANRPLDAVAEQCQAVLAQLLKD